MKPSKQEKKELHNEYLKKEIIKLTKEIERLSNLVAAIPMLEREIRVLTKEAEEKRNKEKEVYELQRRKAAMFYEGAAYMNTLEHLNREKSRKP